MSSAVKFLIGLAAVLLMGWIYHGPLGNGARLIDRIERQAQAAVAKEELPGIDVRLSRDPLSRRAILSGPANNFQREGMGSQPGLTDIVAGTRGVGSVAWADEGAAGAGAGMPLLLETWILAFLAYLAGVAGAWLIWGRPRRESYL